MGRNGLLICVVAAARRYCSLRFGSAAAAAA